jgi:hypothetical protein
VHTKARHDAQPDGGSIPHTDGSEGPDESDRALSRHEDPNESHTALEIELQRVELLQPREERYETELSDDFYVCTWPNGLKTWLFVYETNGYRRRRTLGTYPEMSLTDAREALHSARKLQQAEEDLLARGLGDAVMRSGSAATPVKATATSAGGKPAAAPLHVRAARTLGTAAAGAALAIGGMFGYATLTTRPAPVQTTPRTAAVETVLNAQSGPGSSTAQAPKISDNAHISGGGEGTTADGQAGADGNSAGAGAGAPAQRNRDPAEDPAPPAGTSASAKPQGGDPATPGADDPATVAPPLDETDPPLARLLQALDGTVSRKLFTPAIVDDEPDGVIPEYITLARGETMTIHFFTEVRGLENEWLKHRWFHDGVLVFEQELRTGDAWRFPLSSAYELEGGSSEGRWRVELCKLDNNLIENAFFLVSARSGGTR